MPGFGSTKALTISVRTGSGTPTTATISTAGWRMMQFLDLARADAVAGAE